MSYTLKGWTDIKNGAAIQAKLLTINPLLPADYKAEQLNRLTQIEDAADQAISLIQAGIALNDVEIMVSQYCAWKFAGDA